MEHQGSYGCRGCSNGHNVLAVAGSGARRAGRPSAAQSAGAAEPAAAPHHGSRLRGKRDTAACAGPGFIPVVPPMSTRVEPWEYDRAMYKRRNEVERLFRRLKGYRRIFSRFEKLDLMFLGFISFVLVADGLRMC